MSEQQSSSATPRTGVGAVDLARLPSVATALGVALLSSAVVVSGLYSRDQDHLDGSNFVMGVLATLALIGMSVGARVVLPDAENRAGLVSWPGALGAVGAGVMLGVLIDKDDASTYATALVILGLSVGGYLVARSAPFVISAIAGLALLYAKVFGDLFDVDGSGSNIFMVLGVGIWVFVVAVTAAGWLLPATRSLTGVVVGVGGLVAMTVDLAAVSIGRFLSMAFSAGGNTLFGHSRPTHHDPYRNDVYVVLLLCLLLAALWMGCALITGHVGFRLLVLATAVVVIPLSTVAVMTHHPTWWEVATAGVGGLVLLGVGLLVKDRSPADSRPAPPAAEGGTA